MTIDPTLLLFSNKSKDSNMLYDLLLLTLIIPFLTYGLEIVKQNLPKLCRFCYSKINYQDVNFFVEKYFSPSDEVLKIKNDIINSYNIDVDKTISVCYRGNDKVNETKIPSYDEILLKIIEIKSKYPTHRLLIQSDEIEFCDFILDKFPDSLIIKETKKINKTTTNLVGNVQRTTPVGERVRTAQIFLAVMYLMSETSHVIMNSGNVGLWICLFRGNSNNISQYLN